VKALSISPLPPSGYEAYPNVVGIVVGLFTVCAITYFLSEKIDSNATDKVTSSPFLSDRVSSQVTRFTDFLSNLFGSRISVYQPLLDEKKTPF
jgi:hypothetical protein